MCAPCLRIFFCTTLLFSGAVWADERFAVRVENGLVFAQLERVPTLALLQQLCAQAQIQLKVVGELPPYSTLQVKAKPILAAIKQLAPELSAIVAEYDGPQGLTGLHLYVQTSSKYKATSASAREQFIYRQLGMSDSDTVAMMASALSGKASGSTAEKLAALTVLKNISGPAARGLIESSLHDQQLAVRMAAVETLAVQAGVDEAIQLLAQQYFQGSAQERQHIASLLVESSHPAALAIQSDINK